MLSERLKTELWNAFPITQQEHDALYDIGWNSGFGWSNQPDWYHNPSEGPAIFLEDDEKWCTGWLSDLETIRNSHLREREKECGPEMADLLRDLVDANDSIGNPVDLAKQIDGVVSAAKNILTDLEGK